MARAAANLGGERRGGPLVGVHEEDPVGRHRVQRSLALRGVVIEGALDDLGARCLRKLGRAVVAARIPDHHRVDPGAQAGDALDDVAGFVAGEDDGDQARLCVLHVGLGCYRRAPNSES